MRRSAAITVTCAGLALGLAGTGTAAPAADRVLVRLAPDADASDRATIRDRLDVTEARLLPRRWRLYRLEDPVTAAEARRALRDLPAERVEIDRPVRAFAPDPYRIQQRHLDRIAAPAAWARGSAAPVTVAVIDTAIAIDHPDLRNRRWVNPAEANGVPGVDDDGNGFVDDAHGINLVGGARDGRVGGTETDPDKAASDAAHGTHVTGLLAAERDNGVAVAGVADNARIIGIRFLAGADRSGSIGDGIEGIAYAVGRGARVINLSWGLAPGSTSQALCDAIAAAGEEGVLVVAAAGNDGAEIDQVRTPMAPATCPAPNLLTVGATDVDTDLLASFSNRGRTAVDMVAPGTQVVAGVSIPGLVSLHPTLFDRAAVMQGTSMSAPVVAGAAALILGRRPDLTPAQVIGLLRTTGAARSDLAAATLTGRRLDLAAAVAAADALPQAGEPTPTITATAPPAGAVIKGPPVFRWDLSGGDPIELRLMVDGVAVRALPGSARSADVPELGDGTYTWWVESTTGAAVTGRRTLTVDSTPPEPFAIRVDPGDRVSVAWEAPTDRVSGVASVTVERNGRVRATAGPGPGVHDAGPLPAPGTSETFAVTATDRAGNRRRVSVDIAVPVNPTGARPAPAAAPAVRARAAVRVLRVAPARYARRYEVRARWAGAAPRVIARGRLAAGAGTVRVRLSAALAARSPRLTVRTARMHSTARTRTVRVRAAGVPRRYTVEARTIAGRLTVARGTLAAGARTIRVRLPRSLATEGPALTVRFRG